MISSNSSIDFISVAKAAGQDPAEFLNSVEFKDWLMEHLAESDITVTFTKKDGTDRVMHCTRKMTMIPESMHPQNVKGANSTDAIPVFDLEKKEWRSFNLSAVKRIDWNLNA